MGKKSSFQMATEYFTLKCQVFEGIRILSSWYSDRRCIKQINANRLRDLLDSRVALTGILRKVLHHTGSEH